jgi:hypothetical protein
MSNVIHSVNDLVTNINSITDTTGKRFSFGVTGGGSTSLSYLMSQPGASTTILEFYCPYAQEATSEYINRDLNPDQKVTVESFASVTTAIRLAEAAQRRSTKIMTTQCSHINELNKITGAIGIGATANLVSKKWKRGDHRILVALYSNEKLVTFSLSLYKGTEEQPFRSRSQEDDLCGKLIVAVTAYECGIFNKDGIVEFLTANGLDSKDILEISDTITNNNLSSLIDGSSQNILCLPQADGSLVQVTNVPIHLLGQYTENKPKLVSLPGSFNPLHPGHTSSLEKALAINATKMPNVCGFYELSVSNVDKQRMTIQELTKRLGHFSMQKYPLFLTNAPRFIDKSAQHPGIDYVMGVDTVIRLVDKSYTDNNQEKMTLLLKDIVDKGTRFFVLPRVYGVANISPSFRVHLEIDKVLTYPMINFVIPTILLPYFTEIEDNEYKGLASSCIRKSLVKSCIS